MPVTNINVSYPYVLRSTVQQTNEGLLYVPAFYTHRRVDGFPSTTLASSSYVGPTGLGIRRFELHNRSGSTISCGIGYRIHNSFWRAGQWTDATTAYTDDTTDAQDTPGTTADFAMEVATTDNDGFVILSTIPFDWVSLRVVTASVDSAAATDHAIRYSNYAGTGWTAVSANSIFTDNYTNTNTVLAAGETNFVWKAPANWGKVVSIGTIPAGYYALNFRATTAADTTAAVASVIEIGRMPFITEGLGDNGLYGDESASGDFINEADAIVAYFSTSNAGNQVHAEVEVK